MEDLLATNLYIKKFKFSPLMVTGIDVDISFSFILTCITFLHCTGQEVSNSTPLSGQGGSAMFSPKTSAQLTPSSSQHAYHFKHPLQNHPNPSNCAHIIIKTKVHILIENTMTTVILFLSMY